VADLAVAPDGSKLYALTLTLPPRQRFPDAGQSVPGAVSVLDPQTGRTLGGPIEVGRTPSALAVSRDGASLYVANEDSVSVISTLENAALGAPIPIAGRPRSITLNADGSAAFVVTKDSLITIDTSTNRVRGVPVPLGADPGSAVVSPDGARIYVSHPDQGTVSVLDTVTGKPAGKPAGKPLPVQGRPGRMAVSADGGTLFVVSTATDQRSSTLLALDLPAGGKVLGAVELDSFTLELALSSNGRRGYVDDLTGGVSVIDTRLMARVGTPTQVDGSPWDIVLSPDDSRLYVATFEGTIAVLNTTDPTTVTDLDVTFD
jgi:DNA-binding beta-propeller fold protein YncE